MMQPNPLTDEIRYPALDGLRGVAALMVLLAHSSNANMHLIPPLNLSGVGRMGLFLFFALSAFLLTDQALAACSRARPSYPLWVFRYLLKRFFRIYPLFVVAVILDIALNRMNTAEAIHALTLVGAKGIFWTVPPEFQYYFLIPVLAHLLSLDARIGIVACTAIVAISLVSVTSLAVWPYLMLFVTSSLAAHILRTQPAFCRRVGYLAPISILAVVTMTPLVISKLLPSVDPLVPRNFSYVYAVVWAPVIYACVFVLKGSAFLGSRQMRLIGKISFGVYLFHPLVISGAEAMGLAGHSMSGIGVLVASLIVGWIANRVVEDPFRVMGYGLAVRLLSGGSTVALTSKN